MDGAGRIVFMFSYGLFWFILFVNSLVKVEIKKRGIELMVPLYISRSVSIAIYLDVFNAVAIS